MALFFKSTFNVLRMGTYIITSFFICERHLPDPIQWQIQGGKGGASVPPFGLHLTLRSIAVKLNGTPFLARKLLLWLTMECFRRNSFENRSIGLVGLVVCLKNDRSGRGFAPEWAWLLKFCACFTHKTITTPLLEILGPPLQLSQALYLELLTWVPMVYIVIDISANSALYE